MDGTMTHPSRLVVVNLGSEPNEVVLTLCRGVHPRTRDTVVRPLVAVASKEILTQGLPHFLEEVPEVSDHRKVSRHRVLSLSEVVDSDDRHNEDNEAEDDQRDGHKHAPSTPYRIVYRRLAVAVLS